MSAYKDEKQGTWYVIFRYIDWTGQKKQKMKRGFRTKKEAVKFENEFKRTVAADMDMQIGSFVEIYFEDKKNELKKSSVRNKRHMREGRLGYNSRNEDMVYLQWICGWIRAFTVVSVWK